VLRALKLAKAFWQSDMNWTDGSVFQTIMSCVIAANTIVMSLELDHPCPIWPYVENVFLAIYVFELSCRIKHEGRSFLYPTNPNAAWNYLDSTVVSGGVVDVWLLPLIQLIEGLLGGAEQGKSQSMGKILSVVRIMRLVRILRLARLLRAIPPLYVLLQGIGQSMQSMKWVLILTGIVIYASAIFFTTVVGQGYLFAGSIPPEADELFGSTVSSMASLFKLMNGDTSVVHPIAHTAIGEFLFVGFMVIANWSILAILTSVVSDKMISASNTHYEEEAETLRNQLWAEKSRRLRSVFTKIDEDSSGAISEQEWKDMLKDQPLRDELCDATDLTVQELNEHFDYLAQDKEIVRVTQTVKGGRTSVMEGSGKVLMYDVLIDSLRSEGETATKKSMLYAISQIRHLQEELYLISTVILRDSSSKADAEILQRIASCYGESHSAHF
jgi:hypothetical protein